MDFVAGRFQSFAPKMGKLSDQSDIYLDLCMCCANIYRGARRRRGDCIGALSVPAQACWQRFSWSWILELLAILIHIYLCVVYGNAGEFGPVCFRCDGLHSSEDFPFGNRLSKWHSAIETIQNRSKWSPVIPFDCILIAAFDKCQCCSWLLISHSIGWATTMVHTRNVCLPCECGCDCVMYMQLANRPRCSWFLNASNQI